MVNKFLNTNLTLSCKDNFELEVYQMPVNQEQLRLVMRQWASGVTVVSAKHNGKSHGMTVSSFTSISIDPPLVIISLMNQSRTLKMIAEASVFGITILSKQQTEISSAFAGKIGDEEDRFANIDTLTLTNGSPMIRGGLAYLDCKVESIYEYASNSLIIGEVIAAELGDFEKPLLYFNKQYHQLQE
jgi:flavin reductase (DIM6/NTAB) family NADH-FMN oxidoreductase RutF